MLAQVDRDSASGRSPAAIPTEYTLPAGRPGGRPTIWGLTPTQLHDHFWAARGVHVVRQGETGPVAADAELYLLTDPRTLIVFRLRPVLDTLSWSKPGVMFVRLRNARERRYREMILTDDGGRFLRTVRYYDGFESRLARVALTRNRLLAEAWQRASDPRGAWRKLRAAVGRPRRETASLTGRAYDRDGDAEVADFVKELGQFWKAPASTVPGLRKVSPGVWAHGGARLEPGASFVGPVWIGAGRSVPAGTSVIGPAVLWDDPAARPAAERVRWDEIEPTDVLNRPARRPRRSSAYQFTKRLFDIAFALLALLLTAPLYAIVMVAIWLEDGRPFFFAHRRETVGGREFPCVKFRSMRNDAERMKAELAKQNQADGPQFFIKSDPRLTRVGKVIRKLNIDELPQFFNVLLGQMSVVGPRPSPRKENQYCPPWREARLSVRPGITGLWQVKRTRKQGEDFQEWIRYDIEYVERANWGLDLYVIAKTIWLIVRGSA
jgi:lipopolysaccharide/colanic/teichoic acid biosynthesis glycosyltransferase